MKNIIQFFRSWKQRRQEKRIQKEREEAEQLKRDIEAFARFCVVTSQVAAALAEISSRMTAFPSGGIVSPSADEGGEYICRTFSVSALRRQLDHAIQNEKYELAAVLRDKIEKETARHG